MSPIGDIAVNTRLILQKLAELKPGDSISYSDVSKLIGRDVRNPRYRGSLQSARKIALRDHGIVTRCEKNTGIFRPANEDLPEHGRKRATHIHRQSALGRRELETADMAALSNEAKIVQMSCLSLLGALEQFTRNKVINNIRRLVDQSMPSRLTLEQTLQAFKVGRDAKTKDDGG